jgi:3-dehydroquinate synthase
MSNFDSDCSTDIEFNVPFTHRLRFTKDVLSVDFQVLLDLLQSSQGQTARVQFWIDEHVARSQPDLRQRIDAFVRQNSCAVSMNSNVQFVPGGEQVKNDIHIIERMLKCMNAADLDRRSYVIVIGGGAVLDAVGFAAAIAHRGIRLIRIPTTTLAQGDSGVGVKNSINLFQKKNWVGTFAVPWAVINDERMLETLPDREFRSGFSECVKVALLKDPDLLADICNSTEQIRDRDHSVTTNILAQSAKWHLQHITRGGDPFEALEARPLDFGHWSAHKLEIMTQFEVSHGEAVAMGVAIDCVYSSLVHGFPSEAADMVLNTLHELGIRLSHPKLECVDQLFAGMEEFRQHLGGRLTLTMLEEIGQPIDVHEVDEPQMRTAIERVLDFAAQNAAT